MSASILPLTSKASKALRMVSSSSAPPAIFSAKSMTICVKLTGPGASESMPWPHRRRRICQHCRKRRQCMRKTRDILVSVHDTESFLELLDLPLGEESKNVGAALLGLL